MIMHINNKGENKMTIKRENLIKMRDIPALVLEMTGVTRTQAAIYMWIRKGLKTYEGPKVKLKTTKRLGHLYTTREWMEEFLRRID